MDENWVWMAPWCFLLSKYLVNRPKALFLMNQMTWIMTVEVCRWFFWELRGLKVKHLVNSITFAHTDFVFHLDVHRRGLMCLCLFFYHSGTTIVLRPVTPLCYNIYCKCHCVSTALFTLCKLCIYYVVLFR